MESLNPLTLSLWLCVGQALAGLLLGSLFRAYRQTYRHEYIGYWSYGFLLLAVHFGCSAIAIALIDDLRANSAARLLLTAVSQFAAYAGVALTILGAIVLGGKRRSGMRIARLLLVIAAAIALFATFAFLNEASSAPRRLYVRVGWRHLMFGSAMILAATALVRWRGLARGLGMRTTIFAFAAFGLQQLAMFVLFFWQAVGHDIGAAGPYLGLIDPLVFVFLGLALSMWLLDEERLRADETTRQFERLSRFDAITGLANERLLREWIGGACTAATRLGHSGALLVVAVDRLDVLAHSTGYGHGDAALVALAERLRKALPSNVPSPARMEGQRFAVVMPSIKTREEIDLLADKLRRAVQEPLLVGSRDLRLGAIVGVSVFPDDADTPVAIIRAAELALRHASIVDSPVSYYQTELRDRAKSRLSLEIELRKALANGEFLLAYQPIVSAADSRLAGFEALIRWRHPERGLQPPALFLPAIEELGLMADLDRWVLREACRQTAAWNAGRDAPVWISVNVTAHSFRDPAFKSNVLETLRETGLVAEHLHLELTEQTALSDVEQATALLSALREAGVAASLDDFGTGYSSLSQLQQLPVERIKLDRSFIANPDNLERDAAIVRALVTLAHTIRLDVVAEGVETDEQRSFCARAGVDLLQGYYFAAPLFPEKCEALLASDARLPAAA